MNLKQSGNKLPLKSGQLFMIGALLMAVVTAVLFTNMMGKNKTAEKPKPDVKLEKVLVAAEFIPAGTALSSQHLRKVDWPSKYLSPGSYFSSLNGVLGRTIKGDIYAGEVIYKQKLLGDASRGGLEVLIPEGMRAVAITVSEVKGVAGFIKPGDHVDVYATFQTEADEKAKIKHGYITRTILQGVQVLATAQDMINTTKPTMEEPEGLKEAEIGKEDTKKEKDRKKDESTRKDASKRAKTASTVTLALTPEQAETMALAEEAAELHLALRNPQDKDEAFALGIDVQELLAGSLGAMPTPIEGRVDLNAASKNTVELIEGTNKTLVEF